MSDMPESEIKIDISPALVKVRALFNDWIFPSIDSSFKATATPGGGTPLAAYILLSCAIDVIAGFYAGRTSPEDRNLGGPYKDFIRIYLTGYSPEKVYKFIRCSLVHNFSIGPRMALTHGNSKAHLITINGVDFKNFENFFSNFKTAVEKYFQDLKSSEDLQKKFLIRSAWGIPMQSIYNIKLP